MIDYMNNICERDFTSLKRIINYKFRKFRSFYWLLREYSDQIAHIHYYDDEDLNTLRLSVETIYDDVDGFADVLNESLDNDSNITIETSNNEVLIIIVREEEPLQEELEIEAESSLETN